MMCSTLVSAKTVTDCVVWLWFGYYAYKYVRERTSKPISVYSLYISMCFCYHSRSTILIIISDICVWVWIYIVFYVLFIRLWLYGFSFFVFNLQGLESGIDFETSWISWYVIGRSAHQLWLEKSIRCISTSHAKRFISTHLLRCKE